MAERWGSGNASCSCMKVEESVRWAECVSVMSGWKAVRHKEGQDSRKYMHIYYIVSRLEVRLQK